jgi:bifunctional non-homologous end joining protein LigD
MTIPPYAPMIPTQVHEPFHRDGWIYEEKVDGWRILAYKDGSRVRLVSRTGVEHSKRFRGVAEAIGALPFDTLVLDGEVAIFDQQLRSRFDWLRGTPDELATPPSYIAFDVLYRAGTMSPSGRFEIGGCCLRTLSRDGGTYILPVRRLADNGLDAWAQVLGSGWEGYVAKDQLSPYRGGSRAPGSRSRRWGGRIQRIGSRGSGSQPALLHISSISFVGPNVSSKKIVS